MDNKIKKKSFWSRYQDKIIEELIKSFFLIVIAITAVFVWEKSKMNYGVSFSKKIDILSSERQSLLENSERFTENYGDLSQYVNDYHNSDFKADYTYKSNVTKIKRLLVKTDLILINSMVENDSLKIFHKNFTEEGKLFVGELENANLNNIRFANISTLFDNITGLYGKEITKEVK